jgi:alkylation response protein AidB-like acyl-CoA dehydrogenase
VSTTMEIELGSEAQAFREELREWLEANRPTPKAKEAIEADSMAEAPRRGRRGAGVGREWRHWAEKLHEGRYLCVSWPKEYGGRGLSGIEVAVMNEEFARAGVPRITRGMGEWLVGPSIIVWGTDEQKAHFLPRIIDGTDRYCQGFSEPDAGSDLASLKTRGVVDGDEIVITGQKVWTSGAQMANMMFCLCRTDPDVPKHQGISYVLVPMEREDGSPNGFELAPIKQMNGGAGFTQTFINEARAPLFNVIAGLNNGWRVTMTTLGNERGGNATTQHVQYTRQFWDAVDMVRERGKAADPLIRQHLAWAFSRTEIMRFQGLRLLSEVVAKKEPGPASSINKMFWSEYSQRFAEILMDIRGADALVMPPQKPEDYRPDRWQSDFLTSRSVTIWGGTAQVQRNIVGERVLGLPKDPSAEDDRAGRR